MSNLPVWAMGYALRQAGVPCAEEIAMMLCRRKQEPKGELLGYSYSGSVLPKPQYDETTYTSALMMVDGDVLTAYVSTKPFRYDDAISYLTYLYVDAPYATATFDRTNGWSAFTETAEGYKRFTSSVTENLFWSNQDILRSSGSAVIRGSEVLPVYTGVVNSPTAFLYDDGEIVLQSHTTPDTNRNVVGAYVGWDTQNYTSEVAVPWLRLASDQTSITSATINDDAIPAWTSYMFCNCTNLTHVDIPDDVEVIGQRTFYKTSVIDLPIPANVKRIGAFAYADRQLLSGFDVTYDSTLTIPNSVEYIAQDAFYNIGSYVTHLYVNAEHIDDYAFEGNICMKNITIGSGVKRIDPYAFHRCGIARGVGQHMFSDFYGNITFENTDGWWVGTDSSATSGTAVDVTDTVQNAKNLAGWNEWTGQYNNTVDVHTEHEGVYAKYYWNRNE